MNIQIYNQIILFIVMFFVGLFFNPMNVLSYSSDDLYISTTLVTSSMFMASNMIWSHQIVHFLQTGHFNLCIFIIGIVISLTFAYILRNQLFVTSNQWLKRMIPHHSTALTTTSKLLDNRKDIIETNPSLYRFAKDIIYNQEREILFMKQLL